ncbi:hypothetical protein QZH41_003686 [Actinostola sp. cb2023]|nr:hypothetical protein QZH41_003686 [Actinostola sp. cb2023]
MWENEEVLYNTRCIDYFKRDKRIEALDRLSDTLKIPIAEIRKKMTNLRTYYGKELWKEKKTQKVVEAEGDPSKGYHSRWLFFKPLDFLRENCNPKHSKHNLNDHASDRIYDADDTNDDDTNDTWDDSALLASLASVNGDKEDTKESVGNELVEEPLSHDQMEVVEASSVSIPQIRESPTKLPEKRKKTGDDLESVIAKLRRTKPADTKEQNKSSLVSPRVDLTSSNPDMVYAHHVGLTLMHIKDAKVKDLAKLRIQQVLFETQYGQGSVDSTQPVQVQAYSQ